jgi:hypothetical protein
MRTGDGILSVDRPGLCAARPGQIRQTVDDRILGEVMPQAGKAPFELKQGAVVA